MTNQEYEEKSPILNIPLYPEFAKERTTNDGNLTSFEVYKLGCELFRMYTEIVIRFGCRMIRRIMRMLEGVIHLDGYRPSRSSQRYPIFARYAMLTFSLS